MRIKINKRMAGPGGNFPPGAVVNVETKTGIALVKNGAISLEPEASVNPEMTKAEIMAVLDKRGIEFHKRMNKSELLELLGG